MCPPRSHNTGNAGSLALVLLTWMSCACARTEYPARLQQIDQDRDRAVYNDLFSPLLAGQELLHQILPRQDAHCQVFRLHKGGAEALAGTVTQDQLWRHDRAVFFRIGSSDKGYRVYYFNPRRIQLQRVERDELSGTFIVVRAVGQQWKPDLISQQLDIMRYDFQLDDETGLVLDTCQRLTDLPGDNRLPLYLPERAQVLFLNRQTIGENPHGPFRQRLCTVPINGGEAFHLASDLGGDCTNLYAFDAHAVLFANNAGGYYRLYRYDLDTDRWLPHQGPVAPGRQDPDALLSCLIEDGLLRPVVLSYPSRFDLESLLALVAAHNPSVNRFRALLAAALIEARQSAQAVGPQLHFGAAYTPAGGWLGDAAASSDVLAIGLSRGILGIAQDLLAIPRQQALSEAGAIRARIARDSLQDELIRRQTACVATWFQARSIDQLLSVDRALVQLADARHRALVLRQEAGHALRSEVDEAERALAQARQDHQAHETERAQHYAQLRQLCGLGDHLPLHLAEEDYRLEEAASLELQELQRLAQLNSPRLRAARLQLSEAFFLRQSGGSATPSLRLGAQYGLTNEGMASFDDYIGLSLSGSFPTNYLTDRALHQRRWDSIVRALELAEIEAASGLDSAVSAARAAFEQARQEWVRHHRQLAWSLEQVRLARLFDEYPLAETSYRATNRGLIAERTGYYEALAQTFASRAEMGSRFARLWATIGSVTALRRHLAHLREQDRDRLQPSLRIADTARLISDDQAIDHLFTSCQRQAVDRLYAAWPARLALLDDPFLRERLRLFLNRCQEQGIAVWLDCGDPAWIDGQRLDYLRRRIQALRRFNSDIAPLHPRICGLRLDLQWPPPIGEASNLLRHQQRRTTLHELLRACREDLPPDCALWLRAPLALFARGHRDLLAALAHDIDGLTALCDSTDPLVLRNSVLRIGEAWRGDYECALTPSLESSRHLRETLRLLDRQLQQDRRYRGIALGDLDGIADLDERLIPLPTLP